MDPFLRSKPGPLAGYADLLLTLYSGVLMIGCLPCSSIVSPHRDQASWEMHFEPEIK